LIQVAALPGFMMRPPECLPVSRPRRTFVSHLDLPSCESAKENRSKPTTPRQVCVA
jgi:hypothetical protein